LLAMDDIDIIEICTPNFVHKEIIIEALKAGKHIICEKPLAMNLNEAKEIVKAAGAGIGIIAMKTCSGGPYSANSNEEASFLLPTDLCTIGKNLLINPVKLPCCSRLYNEVCLVKYSLSNKQETDCIFYSKINTLTAIATVSSFVLCQRSCKVNELTDGIIQYKVNFDRAIEEGYDAFLEELNHFITIKAAKEPTNYRFNFLKELICPFSKKIFEEPLVALCGHTFDKTAFVKSNKCPYDGSTLNLTETVPNIIVSSLIDDITRIFKSVFSKLVPLTSNYWTQININQESLLETKNQLIKEILEKDSISDEDLENFADQVLVYKKDTITIWNAIKSQYPDRCYPNFDELEKEDALKVIKKFDLWVQCNFNEIFSLQLSDLNIHYLHYAIGHLVDLKILFLAWNNLKKLPESFFELTKLRELNLSENHLKTLPRSINRLVSLKKISLRCNDLEELPDTIGDLKELRDLYVTGNPLKPLFESAPSGHKYYYRC
ncbi:MAG: hypothetical protein KR126chlam6_01387, partial [Candidatus Anoxychlamydiales bacterium]|nr:hypothetical protein [Candidatus Anoxychlamydiales bacterium]